VHLSYFEQATVLITGASAGIGWEFARQLGPAAKTMILVGRRKDRLEALGSELKAINPELDLRLKPRDLCDKAELREFCDWLDENRLAVDVLINNAGVGDHGMFAGSEWERVDAMLQVNVYALTYLTFRIAPAMTKAGRGAILNVSSVAGLLPVPNSAVYAATKAYVNSFSEAIRAELRLSNISVTALCPGPVDTEFLSRATRRTDRQSHTAPDFFVVSVHEVVRQALVAVSKDRARVIPGTMVNWAMTILAYLPMFIKRLLYQAQLKRRRSDVLSPSPNL
jgi:short-subunit dehydrogenase